MLLPMIGSLSFFLFLYLSSLSLVYLITFSLLKEESYRDRGMKEESGHGYPAFAQRCEREEGKRRVAPPPSPKPSSRMDPNKNNNFSLKCNQKETKTEENLPSMLGQSMSDCRESTSPE